MKHETIMKLVVLLVLVTAPAIASSVVTETESDPYIFTIEDGNSTATFNVKSNLGMYSWTINDVEQLKQQWFWFRIGDTGPEMSISSLELVSAGVETEDDFIEIDDVPYLIDDGENEIFTAIYEGEGFEISLSFGLHGGALGETVSQIDEIITITNTSDESLDFHFFQYCDLDLGDTEDDTFLQMTGDPGYLNTAEQSDEEGYLASENVVTKLPSHYEAYSSELPYDSIYDRLTDDETTTLGDVTGPFTDGDLSWAFQWDLTIPVDDCVQISKLKGITPEPTTVCLLSAGGIGLLIRRRQRK